MKRWTLVESAVRSAITHGYYYLQSLKEDKIIFSNIFSDLFSFVKGTPGSSLTKLLSWVICPFCRNKLVCFYLGKVEIL